MKASGCLFIASGYKTWLSRYLDKASGCLRLPNLEMSTNKTLLETTNNQSTLHHSKKSWENKSQLIRINMKIKQKAITWRIDDKDRIQNLIATVTLLYIYITDRFLNLKLLIVISKKMRLLLILDHKRLVYWYTD